ncbi:MAG TPA: YidC/Oxa1 family membrane protein insertase [Acidimicrobiales bacterium]|nr:YidC/Oxa1 family membrane protein insertase [Acidimicrobiales bacterium]
MASIIHTIGSVFQPIFHLFGWILAFLYGLIPNYAVAIALLTVVIMGALTPFTIKSTKSMMAMQKLQPEIKKLQQKYKGPENRQVLNEELMRLYREEGANPVGGCLPVLLQAPFLFILYSVIKGLANVTAQGIVQPRYIPATSKMYHNLVASHGQINAFGMDLNLKPFSSHGSIAAAIPFYVFVVAAVGLQYFQMAQMNNRNRKTGQAMPSQQQAMQRFLPIVFAYFYLVIPAAVVLYMIVSTVIRIITQDLMFRAGVSNPNKGVQRSLPGAEKSKDSEDESAPEQKATPAKPEPKPSTFKSTQQSRSKSKRKRKAR